MAFSGSKKINFSRFSPDNEEIKFNPDGKMRKSHTRKPSLKMSKERKHNTGTIEVEEKQKLL